ncbi:MAG TPA: VOC family protein [Polyangia bacterium]|jgi:hypothetical protein|nr:VOC family protein [Polyangia bacterium]
MTVTPPIVHIEFRSSDFARASAFYAKALGWQTQQNANSTYMKLDSNDSLSTGWVRADLGQAPGPLAYVEVDDLVATLAQVEKAGGRVIVPHRPFAGGGEVALFADPDGNVVGLWARKKGAAAIAAPAAATKPKPVAAAKPAKPAPPTKPAKPAGKPAKPSKR